MELKDRRVVAILPVGDIERARGFYEGKLGLRSPVEMPVPEDGAIYQCGGETLIYLYQRPSGVHGDHTAAGWLVEDIDAAVHTLTEKGIGFERYDGPDIVTNARGIAEVGGSRVAWFRDSEGNVLSIVEMFPGRD